MRTLILISMVSLLLSGCFISNYESDLIQSPSGDYSIKSTVNRTDSDAPDYASVVIHLYDKDGKMIRNLDSGAGDANKWALGWTTKGDTIVLQSSDIGNQAWIFYQDNFQSIDLSSSIDKRAKQLYNDKYYSN